MLNQCHSNMSIVFFDGYVYLLLKRSVAKLPLVGLVRLVFTFENITDAVILFS